MGAPYSTRASDFARIATDSIVATTGPWNQLGNGVFGVLGDVCSQSHPSDFSRARIGVDRKGLDPSKPTGKRHRVPMTDHQRSPLPGDIALVLLKGLKTLVARRDDRGKFDCNAFGELKRGKRFAILDQSTQHRTQVDVQFDTQYVQKNPSIDREPFDEVFRFDPTTRQSVEHIGGYLPLTRCGRALRKPIDRRLRFRIHRRL